MTVDYKIGIGNGGVIISQHADATASSSSAPPQAVGGNLTILGTTYAGSKAAKAAAKGGDPVGPLDRGGDPVGPLDRGGNNPGPTRSVPPPGQITIFGPVFIGVGPVQK